jgi:cob(I)alamin adenosyltransferase
MKRSPVTTKRGDKGETTTLGGERLSKAHVVIECTGCVDELRAATALARQHVLSERPADYEAVAAFLLWLLHVYFLIGSQCSDPRNRRPQYRRGDLGQKHIDRLESEQRRFEEAVSLPRQFIVSATTPLAAELDVLATIARRVERAVVRLKEAVPEFDAAHVMVFVNRLSDTLFMLARYLEGGDHRTVDYQVLD